MATLHDLAERFGYDDLAVACPEVDIPVLTGLQRQGDILVVPWQPPAEPRIEWLTPLAGLEVLAGVNGHCHTLHGAGHWVGWWSSSEPAMEWFIYEVTGLDPVIDLEVLLGVVRVPDDGEAFLMHSDEHGALGIGPGWYQVRSQREYQNDGWVGVLD